MSDAAVHWQLEGSGARLHCGPLQADVFIDPQGVSLARARWLDKKVEPVLLRVTTGPRGGAESRELSEVYVRGNDLVVTYAKSQRQRVAPQIYLRAAHESTGAARVEIILSVHTDLLHSLPESTVGCVAMNAQLFHTSRLNAPQFEDVAELGATFDGAVSREHLFVLRRHDRAYSYAQMAHPTDFVSASASLLGGQAPNVFLKLFPELLEKGVIRRGRVCGWFLPVENDLATAVELARRFIDEPLPLTA